MWFKKVKKELPLNRKTQFKANLAPTWKPKRLQRHAHSWIPEESGVFLYGFFVFFRSRERKGRISKNYWFHLEKIDIFNGLALQNWVKINKNSKLEVKIRFWRPKISQDVDFRSQEDDFRGQEEGFGGQEADFGRQKGGVSSFILILRIARRSAQGL